MQLEELKKVVVQALEDMKANDINILDVRGLTGVTDLMVFASGTSSRHVKSIANSVAVDVKKQGVEPLGVEGEASGDWTLVDLGDIVVHVMMPEARIFYDLEGLWQRPSDEEAS